ncbi:unnamed protein product [Cuscuta campestris]|uniref:Uncharacterized protein n=1 Tax=Cuscuta campestris TaxID=132261 RepID=A0A484MQN8_9ASTE|nr:unnamed protein product [Cuscuta campestris]
MAARDWMRRRTDGSAASISSNQRRQSEDDDDSLTRRGSSTRIMDGGLTLCLLLLCPSATGCAACAWVPEAARPLLLGGGGTWVVATSSYRDLGEDGGRDLEVDTACCNSDGDGN